MTLALEKVRLWSTEVRASLTANDIGYLGCLITYRVENFSCTAFLLHFRWLVLEAFSTSCSLFQTVSVYSLIFLCQWSFISWWKVTELCSRGNRLEIMSSVNKCGNRRRTLETRTKTKIITFRQTQIIQQIMMKAWDNGVSCLGDFFFICWTSLQILNLIRSCTCPTRMFRFTCIQPPQV